jgi:hypothetical protein
MNGGMILTGDKRNTRNKSLPVPLCPQQIPHGLAWNPTRVSAEADQQLTAWATENNAYYGSCGNESYEFPVWNVEKTQTDEQMIFFLVAK